MEPSEQTNGSICSEVLRIDWFFWEQGRWTKDWAWISHLEGIYLGCLDAERQERYDRLWVPSMPGRQDPMAMNLKSGWQPCPHCKKKIIVVVSDKDNEVELFSEKDYPEWITGKGCMPLTKGQETFCYMSMVWKRYGSSRTQKERTRPTPLMVPITRLTCLNHSRHNAPTYSHSKSLYIVSNNS